MSSIAVCGRCVGLGWLVGTGEPRHPRTPRDRAAPSDGDFARHRRRAEPARPGRSGRVARQNLGRRAADQPRRSPPTDPRCPATGATDHPDRARRCLPSYRPPPRPWARQPWVTVPTVAVNGGGGTSPTSADVSGCRCTQSMSAEPVEWRFSSYRGVRSSGCGCRHRAHRLPRSCRQPVRRAAPGSSNRCGGCWRRRSRSRRR